MTKMVIKSYYILVSVANLFLKQKRGSEGRERRERRDWKCIYNSLP